MLSGNVDLFEFEGVLRDDGEMSDMKSLGY